MAARRTFLTLGIAVTMALTVLPVGRGAGLEFSSPYKTIAFPQDIAAGLKAPKWINGRLVFLRTDLASNDSRANVYVYGPDGRKIYEARVWPGEASRVVLLDMAVSPLGDVAVVGRAHDRAWPGSFFARISPAGEVSPAVRIQPFEGNSITFGPDGTLWIFGFELDHLRSFGPDHATLHHYTADGKPLGEFLPWSGFGCSANVHPAMGGGVHATLLASRDRIVVLTAGCERWMELSPEGELLRTASLSESGLLPALLAAMTSDNRIYVRPTSSLALCRLQVNPRACEEIAGLESYELLGADGEALVVRNGPLIEWRRPAE